MLVCIFDLEGIALLPLVNIFNTLILMFMYQDDLHYKKRPCLDILKRQPNSEG